MGVHYINILMFVLLLNILVYNQRNHKNIILHTPNENQIKTHRSLCECELFAPQNYDDPEMKSVMQDFDRQTSRRFREYGERMIRNRQKCKDQCDKDIQKIILKDKIEKELKAKLATLETNINTKDLPICECDKSVAYKIERNCLKCGGLLGSGIAPSVGLFSGVVLNAWKATALKAAIKAAIVDAAAEGAAEGAAKGAAEVIRLIISTFHIEKLYFGSLESIIDAKTYMSETLISGAIKFQHTQTCTLNAPAYGTNDAFCNAVTNFSNVPGFTPGNGLSTEESINLAVKGIVSNGKKVAETTSADVTLSKTYALKETNMTAVQAGFESYITSIYPSIIAILIIILVMIIIYLILRYRRKKKMKKKLQYIKLLKE
ncbi:PIR protein, putative [Plasmodium sp. gorilla clade G1]|nr:PIR protein, putative [Plasmodium sp. gorilla clade G1]